VANSDAKALARYLTAVGLQIGPDRLYDLLVLLAVIMIEAGGGLSLAIGIALSSPCGAAGEASPDIRANDSRPLLYCHGGLTGRPSGHSDRPVPATHPVTPARPPTVRPATVVDWLVGKGGRALTSRRKLADALGRRPTALADELHRLAIAGAIRMATSPRGTVLELLPLARPN
jgi:hypothetical protein